MVPPGVLTRGSPGAPSTSMAGTGWKRREMGGVPPDILPTAGGLGGGPGTPRGTQPPGAKAGGGTVSCGRDGGPCHHRGLPSAVCPPWVLCSPSGCHRCVPRVPCPPQCHVYVPPAPRASPQFRVPNGCHVPFSVVSSPGTRCPPSGCHACPPVPYIPPSAMFLPVLCPTRVSCVFPSPPKGHVPAMSAVSPSLGAIAPSPWPHARGPGVTLGSTPPGGVPGVSHAAWR